MSNPCEPGEWVWIIDCSIQMGAMKCLLILGVRMDNLRERKDFTLSHICVRPIILKTVESCRGEVVKAALEEAKIKTGGAIAIISDEGPELKRGVRLFLEDHRETKKPLHLSDIMHKADLALKKALESDSEWINFTKELQNTTQRLKQTSSSHLIPPKQHQKKRRMRSEIDVIEWGVKIIKYLDAGKASNLENHNLSWIIKYRDQLTVYQEMAICFDMCVKQVREHGYSHESFKALKEKENLMFSSNQSKAFFSKLLEIIEQEISKIPNGSKFLGCSEIIESIFGKFKNLEKNYASLGLTSLVLSIPTFLGEISADILKMAMEQISINDVNEWIKANIGDSFWTRRRKDLGKDTIQHKNYLDLHEFNFSCTG